MPRRYSMDKRAADLDATKRALVEAALLVVAEHGVEGLTVQAVADEADVAVRTVYNHFGSRDGLVDALSTELVARTRGWVSRVAVETGSPRERLVSFVGGYADSYHDQGRALDALLAAMTQNEVSEVVQEIRTWRREQIERMVRAAQRAGDLRVPAPLAVETVYLATAHAAWSTMVNDAGLAPAVARRTLVGMVEAALFGAERDAGTGG